METGRHFGIIQGQHVPTLLGALIEWKRQL